MVFWVIGLYLWEIVPGLSGCAEALGQMPNNLLRFIQSLRATITFPNPQARYFQIPTLTSNFSRSTLLIPPLPMPCPGFAERTLGHRGSATESARSLVGDPKNFGGEVGEQTTEIPAEPGGSTFAELGPPEFPSGRRVRLVEFWFSGEV